MIKFYKSLPNGSFTYLVNYDLRYFRELGVYKWKTGQQWQFPDYPNATSFILGREWKEIHNQRGCNEWEQISFWKLTPQELNQLTNLEYLELKVQENVNTI